MVDGNENITDWQSSHHVGTGQRNWPPGGLLYAVPKKFVGGDQPFCLSRELTALQGMTEQ
jgi:hypothetical protein